MKKTGIVILCVGGLGISSVAQLSWAEQGRVIDFLIEDNGNRLLQQALLQDRKICVEKVGGDPKKDLLFDAPTRTLFIINHRDQSYHHIDQEVVNKAASVVESVSNFAETQQGVLADFLQTLGFSEEKGGTVVIEEGTHPTMTVGETRCTLFRQFHNGTLEMEMCLSSQDSLSALGTHYETLNTLYIFGEQLLNRAGSLLSNLGVVIPRVLKPGSEGLPILVHSVGEGIVMRLVRIRNQNPAADCFFLPGGYTRVPIPFIG